MPSTFTLSTPITIESTVAAAQQHVFSNLGSEAVILNLENGVYYGLNPVGVSIWQIIQTPHTVRAICQSLVMRFDVAPDRCEREVLVLLNKMAHAKLIEITDESRT